jgi:hypothetical protein
MIRGVEITFPDQRMLRCADRTCIDRAACLRWIDIDRESTTGPVAGSLYPFGCKPGSVECPYRMPLTEFHDFSRDPR